MPFMVPNPDTKAGGTVKHPMYDGPGGEDLEASHAFASERAKTGPQHYKGYVEKGTYGQFVPGAIMNRALSNGEMFRQVQTMPVTANDPRPHRSLELIDYVEEATEGQWGKNDQKWGLIRMGMDARDQERSKQEQELGRSNGSRGHFDAGHT